MKSVRFGVSGTGAVGWGPGAPIQCQLFQALLRVVAAGLRLAYCRQGHVCQRKPPKNHRVSFPCFIAQLHSVNLLDSSMSVRDGDSLAEVCRHFASGFALPCVGRGPRDFNYSKIRSINGGNALGWARGQRGLKAFANRSYL